MSIENLIKSHNWNLPTVCPACGSELDINENHTRIFCTNDYCPSKVSGKILKWVNTMKIKELGLTTIQTIQDNEFFLDVSNLYEDQLRAEPVLRPLLGKNWENIKKEINSHKSMTLAQFVAGYNISGIGEKQIQKIIKAKGYKSIEDFVGNDQFRFICDGIGDVLSVKLHNGIQLNIDDMRKTLNYVTLIEEEKTEGKLSGLSFCFTGAMEYKRSDLQKMVKDNGGENFDSVKKGLSYLVMQDLNSTSGKAKKAREQGTNLITVEQFLSMID